MAASESSRRGDELGTPNPAQQNCGDLDICPDLVVAAFAAALAAGFAVLFTLITGAGRRRRRRSASSASATAAAAAASLVTTTRLWDLLWSLGTGSGSLCWMMLTSWTHCTTSDKRLLLLLLPPLTVSLLLWVQSSFSFLKYLR